MAFDISAFKSNLTAGGARPNLFEAVVNNPINAAADSTFRFVCRAAQLPGSTIPAIDVPYFGRQVRIAGNRTFEPWTVTIINTTDFAVRDSMEAWMNGINGHATNTGLVNPADYQSDLIVDQLDRDESVLKSYTFRGCFPTNVGAIDLNYDTTGAIEEFPVEFQIQYWESNTTT